MVDKRLYNIIENTENGISPGKDDCVYLLGFDEAGFEASLIRAAANDVIRRKSDNSAAILAQIGISVSECKGGCKFCVFGEGHTKSAPFLMTDDEIREKVIAFNDKDDLYGLFLMTMHDYNLDFLLNTVKIVKSEIKPEVQLWVNVGDSDVDSFREMKNTGVYGIYHVSRLGEGTDTALDPDERIETMHNAMDAGLKLYTCCEPIGPEHTPQQLTDNIFIGIENGCSYHAAMRRVAVPGSPLAKFGQISELRLAQVTAVVSLASFSAPNMVYCGVHEPNSVSCISGSNMIFAETGANPRDTAVDTSKNRGMDMNDCRKMFYECGFKYLRRGDENKIPLSFEYIY